MVILEWALLPDECVWSRRWHLYLQCLRACDVQAPSTNNYRVNRILTLFAHTSIYILHVVGLWWASFSSPSPPPSSCVCVCFFTSASVLIPTFCHVLKSLYVQWLKCQPYWIYDSNIFTQKWKLYQGRTKRDEYGFLLVQQRNSNCFPVNFAIFFFFFVISYLILFSLPLFRVSHVVAVKPFQWSCDAK